MFTEAVAALGWPDVLRESEKHHQGLPVIADTRA